MNIVFPIVLIALSGIAGSESVAATTHGATQQRKEIQSRQKESAPVACTINALTAKQRQRHAELRKQMHQAIKEVKELPDGYALRFAADAKIVLSLAEFISFERLCCPFFNFQLEIASDEQPIWLRLTGDPEAKEILKAEFANQ
ncbi:MAG: hypothetical protein HY231_17985 [Acidobacteria bacterium]|nr:hypothetical protein [Acidobacteriota bacterium]